MSAKNKAIARRVREEIWNKKNLDVADEIISARCVHHTLDPMASRVRNGPAGHKQIATTYLTAFPDVFITIEDVISEDDRVVIRWTARGTHRGALLGTAPTGRPVAVTGIDIYRIAHGKIEETWVNWDRMGFLRQLGVMAQAAR